MMRVDVTRMPASAALRLGLLAGFLVAAGCSGPASDDKSDNPALKASMQKSMEIYKSKTQAKKGNPAAVKIAALSPSSPSDALGEDGPRSAGRGWRDRGGGPMGLRVAFGCRLTRSAVAAAVLAALGGACAILGSTRARSGTALAVSASRFARTTIRPRLCRHETPARLASTNRRRPVDDGQARHGHGADE